jgi:hypothetical protein
LRTIGIWHLFSPFIENDLHTAPPARLEEHSERDHIRGWGTLGSVAPQPADDRCGCGFRAGNRT